MLAGMDTTFIESFVIVAGCGSIAEAARRQNLTSATVAQRIRTLEAELGTQLLARAGRTVRPTEGGLAILEQATRLTRDVRELRSLARANVLAGELRIGVIPTAMTGLMPDVLSALASKAPQVDIHVMPSTSMEVYDRLLRGEVHAALIVQPPFAVPKTVEWVLVREERLVVIAPGALPIGNPMELLSSQPFIRYDRRNWCGRLADTYLRRHDIRPHERFELGALDSIAVLVARGLGVSLVPDWAPPWPAGLVLNKEPVHAPDLTRKIGLLHVRNSAHERLIQLLRTELLADVLPRKPGRARLAAA